MPSMLPHGLAPQEFRILQEFRRLGTEEMDLEQIRAIKHPSGGGEAPARTLVEKGWLSSDGASGKLALTQTAKELLSYDPKPGAESI